MKPYFEEMTPFGKPLTDKQIEAAKENVADIEGVEKQVDEAVEALKNSGLPEKILKKRGQLNVWERIEYLIDPGTWCPLHTLYDPQNYQGITHHNKRAGSLYNKDPLFCYRPIARTAPPIDLMLKQYLQNRIWNQSVS